jgi:hypothetical protein
MKELDYLKEERKKYMRYLTDKKFTLVDDQALKGTIKIIDSKIKELKSK